MEQQQIKVEFPIGTKLIISLVSLLFVFIICLNIITILLFREDKIAYVYQTQAIESQLLGRHFISRSTHTMDTLKTMLAAIDPSRPAEASKKTALSSILDNQSNILLTQIYLVQPSTASMTLYSQVMKEPELTELKIDLKAPLITEKELRHSLPELMQTGFTFLNLTQLGGPPLLGLILADRFYKNSPHGMPIALGLISLKNLSEIIHGEKITVANRQGWVLFDSNSTQGLPSNNVSQHPLFQNALGSKLNNGTMEFDFSHQHLLGTYELPGFNLIVFTTTEWENAMRATYILIQKFALLGAIAIGTAIIFSIFFAKTLTAPIVSLFEATQEVGRGNFHLSLKEEGRDEIGVLSRSFNAMSRKIIQLIQESIDKVILENELSIAALVQKNLIPQSDFKNEWIEIQSFYRSSAQCGGDWWGFFNVGNKIAFMVADATGHGFPSALITASARSCFSVIQKLSQDQNDILYSPKALLSFANRVIFDSGHGQIMMTFFVGVIDLDQKTLTYASAGHNPPWLFKKENQSYTLKSLTTQGQRLGESIESPEFEEKRIQIDRDDILFLYTDGLTEGKNLQGEMFGKKKVRQILESNLNLPPKKLVEKLKSEFLTHNGSKTLDDDVTIAVAQILK